MKDLIKSGSMGRMFALDRFDSIFKEVFDPFFERFDELWKDWDLDMQAFEKLQPKSSFPKVNVIEKKDSYNVEIAVAGFDKNEIELELKDNSLFIKANRKEASEKEDWQKNYLKKEIAFRSFRRVINFPAEIDPEKVSAKHENGIIIVSVAKSVADAEKESIKIDIN